MYCVKRAVVEYSCRAVYAQRCDHKDTKQYSTIQYNTIQYKYNTIQYNTNTIQYKYNTIQYNTIKLMNPLCGEIISLSPYIKTSHHTA